MYQHLLPGLSVHCSGTESRTGSLGGREHSEDAEFRHLSIPFGHLQPNKLLAWARLRQFQIRFPASDTSCEVKVILGYLEHLFIL